MLSNSERFLTAKICKSLYSISLFKANQYKLDIFIVSGETRQLCQQDNQIFHFSFWFCFDFELSFIHFLFPFWYHLNWGKYMYIQFESTMESEKPSTPSSTPSSLNRNKGCYDLPPVYQSILSHDQSSATRPDQTSLGIDFVYIIYQWVMFKFPSN